MLIALAAPRAASSVEDGLRKVERCVSEAAGRGARVVCFPEAYLPGLRGLDFDVAPFNRADQDRVVSTVRDMARKDRVAVIVGMEWHADNGRQIAALAVDERGEVLGVQTKNQLDPTEEPYYVPGESRRLFEVEGLTFGVAICHEGFRYPETVRWAAARGAKVVFHPHCTGSDKSGVVPNRWADAEGPYYEKAMMCRALENTIFLASANYAFRYPESATCVIGPDGKCLAQLPYGTEGVLVHDLNLEAATGLLASRYAPERYRE